MKLTTLGISILILTTAANAAVVDSELEKLRSAVTSAMSQADMNICSRDLAIYLDQKLSKQEDVIRKGLDSEAKKLFEAAAVSFRVYRLKQASFEAAFYRGGTMQPLVLNLAFARITEERFAVLNRDPERKSQVK